MEKEKKPVIKEQDLLELLSTLIANKRFIIRFTLIFFAFGILLTFTSVKKYTVEVMVAPESSEATSLAGNLGSLASMVGIDLGSSSNDAIYPLLYPDIVSSLPFLSTMMNVRITTEEGIDTTYSYYQEELQKKLTEINKANETAQKTHAEQLGKLQVQLKAQTEASTKQSKEFNESLKKMQDTNGQLQKTLEKMTAQNTQTSKELNEAKDKARLLEKQLTEASSKNGSNIWMIVAIIAIIAFVAVLIFR